MREWVAESSKAGQKWEKYMSELEGNKVQWSHGEQIVIKNRSESYTCTV